MKKAYAIFAGRWELYLYKDNRFVAQFLSQQHMDEFCALEGIKILQYIEHKSYD